MVFRKYCKDGVALGRESFARERWDALPMVMTLCHSVQVSEMLLLEAATGNVLTYEQTNKFIGSEFNPLTW